MSETMKDYENELDASTRKLEAGDLLVGTVVSVDEKEVTLDLNYYAAGIISAEDFSREPGFNLKERVQVGDEVTATVTNPDDHGFIRLSKVDATEVLVWDKLQAMKDSKEVLTVTIKGAVKGGAVAYVEDVRGFIPASKLDFSYVEDTTSWLGRQVKVQVVDVDKNNKKLVLSARNVLRKEAEEQRKREINNVQVGYVTEAVVETLQPYGVFVRMDNGLSGLVHISQLAHKRVQNPSEVLSAGDRVKVKVIGKKDGKLSLSIKEADESYTPREPEEEKVVIPVSGEEATTSLGDLFKNIKLS